jgi:hypothetical protein
MNPPNFTPKNGRNPPQGNRIPNPTPKKAICLLSRQIWRKSRSRFRRSSRASRTSPGRAGTRHLTAGKLARFRDRSGLRGRICRVRCFHPWRNLTWYQNRRKIHQRIGLVKNPSNHIQKLSCHQLLLYCTTCFLVRINLNKKRLKKALKENTSKEKNCLKSREISYKGRK